MSYKWEPIKDSELKWWLTDFDNTICHNTGYPDFIPTTPLDGAVEALNLLDSKGWKITIHTARSWADYFNIEGWCKHYGIPVRRIICGKPLGVVAYDDKNFGTTINWQEVIDKVK